MSANDISQSLEAVDLATRECQLACEVMESKLQRVVAQTFRDGGYAYQVLAYRLGKDGPEKVIALLNQPGVMRATFFGPLRGGFFSSHELAAAREGLNELPEIIRERAILRAKLNDLVATRFRLLDRADRDRLNKERQQSHTPQNDRTRQRGR